MRQTVGPMYVSCAEPTEEEALPGSEKRCHAGHPWLLSQSCSLSAAPWGSVALEKEEEGAGAGAEGGVGARAHEVSEKPLKEMWSWATGRLQRHFFRLENHCRS